jgi:hypothetical protein
MWYKKGEVLIGVLNDYDLSSLADEPGPRGNERTGTVPFMALDLFTKKGQRGEVKHLYRHDLESFMWCFAWIYLRYKEGVLLPWGSRPLDEWATSDAVTCGMEKFFFMGHLFDFQPPHLQTSGSVIDWSLWKLLMKCFQMLYQADNVRRVRLQEAFFNQSEGGAGEQINDEETETELDLFEKFKGILIWAKLKDPSDFL